MNAFWDALQARQEEDEVDRNLLPDRDQHDHKTGIKTVRRFIKIPARGIDEFIEIADQRIEQKITNQARDRSRHGINPDQQGLVGACPSNDLIRAGRQQQRYGQ